MARRGCSRLGMARKAQGKGAAAAAWSGTERCGHGRRRARCRCLRWQRLSLRLPAWLKRLWERGAQCTSGNYLTTHKQLLLPHSILKSPQKKPKLYPTAIGCHVLSMAQCGGWLFCWFFKSDSVLCDIFSALSRSEAPARITSILK